jgi:hypothetical protein
MTMKLIFSFTNRKKPVAFSQNNVYFLTTKGQFHKHSTRSFYVRKLGAQLFCAYVLGFYFTGARLLAQKLRVERW